MKKREAYSYVELAESIGEDIAAGKYAAGGRCPSLTQIMRQFGVSRMTAARAVDDLRKKGLVASRQGKGTFVTRVGVSRKIGLIVPGIAYSEIFPPICQQIAHLAQRSDYALLFGDLSSANPVERGRRAKLLAQQYLDENVTGVLFQPVEFLENADAVNRDILAAFDAAGVPVVLLDCDIVPSPGRSRYDIVGVNNVEAGRRLAQHLKDVGARNVAFLTSPHSDYSVVSRIAGARGVLLENHCRFSERSVDVKDPAAVRRMLSRRPCPDAIICRNDHQAAHLMVTLRKIGKRVPEDVMLAGFNDVALASILQPGLTTIRLPCEDIARQAFEFLCDRIARPELPTRECCLSAPLVIRASTKLPNA